MAAHSIGFLPAYRCICIGVTGSYIVGPWLTGGYHPRFASALIEDGLSPGVTTAFFLQGCSGDVNPIGYKDVDRPKDALPLGHILGHTVLRAARAITPSTAQTELRVVIGLGRKVALHYHSSTSQQIR